MSLKDKVAIVTGAATGIGRAIALRLARNGANVVVDYVGEEEGANEVIREIGRAGGEALAIAADVSDERDVEGLVNGAVQRFGRLDILVNNAGIERKYPFLQTPTEYWNKVIAVNLTGPFLCARSAATRMVAQGEGGRIINISSVHEDLPMTTNAPYCATKGGLRMLMRTVALELAPHKITVNDVAPGAIDTPMDAPLKAHADEMRELLSEIPLGRMGRPDEVAELCAYLASDAAAYITGTTVFIDGGMIRHAGSL
jgi:glucose 1-dehydrogenase